MLLMFFILIRDLTYASTIAFSQRITDNHIPYMLGFYLVQVIAAPIQASYSDHSCRKKGLIFAFSMVVIGHALLFYAIKYGTVFLCISLFISGVFGNVIPIAIAALMDLNYLKNIKKLMSIVMLVLAVAWLLYEYLLQFFDIQDFFWITTLACVLCVILAFFFFEDKRDKDKSVVRFNLIRDVQKIQSTLNLRWFFLVIKGYLFTEIVYYTLFYFHVMESVQTNHMVIITAYAIGYMLGNIVPFFVRATLLNTVKLGLAIAIVSVVCLIISSSFLQVLSWWCLIILSGLFSFGYGVMDPCIYTHIGENQPVHKRGKIFGIVDSTDNISEMTTTAIFLFIKPSINILRTISIIMILFSFFYFKKSFLLNKKTN